MFSDGFGKEGQVFLLHFTYLLIITSVFLVCESFWKKDFNMNDIWYEIGESVWALKKKKVYHQCTIT